MTMAFCCARVDAVHLCFGGVDVTDFEPKPTAKHHLAYGDCGVVFLGTVELGYR